MKDKIVDVAGVATNQIVVDAEETELEKARVNIFKPLVPEAKTALRSILLTSENEKLVKETAQDILDRAGEVKKVETRAEKNIIISDSNIIMIMNVLKEVKDVL